MLDYSGIGLVVKRVKRRRGGKSKFIYKTMALLESSNIAQTSAQHRAYNPGARSHELDMYEKTIEHI
jgi:hypothetical protein